MRNSLVGVIFCILFIIQENFVIADGDAGLEKSKRPMVGHCGDGKSDPLDTKTHWKDACYDIDGNSYKYGDFLMSCCGCFKFICSNKTEESKDEPNCIAKYGWDKVLEDTCCEDCHGEVFPAGSVMKEQIVKDKCATTVTTKCVFISGENKATIEESLSYEKCCSNSSGVYPIDTSMLVPKECSVRTCSRPWGRHEASWTLTKEAEGCDCCVYRGKLYSDKAWVLIKGQNATCCEGKWLVSIEDEEEIVTTTECGGRDSGCCTPSTPCGIYDGDCDSDADCKPGLICGSNNCPNKGVAHLDVNTWDRTDDCCTTPSGPPDPTGFGGDGKCFHNDSIITFHDLGKNHWGQTTKPIWIIEEGGRRLRETENTRPSVGITNLGDASSPVSFTGIVYSNSSDMDVLGMVFGYHNETNFFVVASSGENVGPTNWYVGRLHATCGFECANTKTISDAIWRPSLHEEDITILASGTDHWRHPNTYRFNICFNPAEHLIDVTIINESNSTTDLNTGIIAAKTPKPEIDEISRLGGHIGVYVDSQANTVWDELNCADCEITLPIPSK